MNGIKLGSFKKSGRLFVITGPSGVGKGTLVKKLLSNYQEIWLSISATTRSPREGEIEGEHYFFLDKKSFNNLVDNKGFLEWAEFAGNFYGTPIKEITRKINEGKIVILEIELEGARQVKESYSDAFLIFIAPPNFQELERRIRVRATDSQKSIQERLLRAKEELNAQNEFNAIVVNEDLEKAFDELSLIMKLPEK